MISRPLEKYVLDKQNYVRDTGFAETKFFYKNLVLDLNLEYENMSKNKPQKPKNCSLNHIHIQKSFTLEKYLKSLLKNWHKNWSILKCFWLEKYLKVVFSTESVWKIAIFKVENHRNSKMGQIKKSCFRGL